MAKDWGTPGEGQGERWPGAFGDNNSSSQQAEEQAAEQARIDQIASNKWAIDSYIGQIGEIDGQIKECNDNIARYSDYIKTSNSIIEHLNNAKQHLDGAKTNYDEAISEFDSYVVSLNGRKEKYDNLVDKKGTLESEYSDIDDLLSKLITSRDVVWQPKLTENQTQISGLKFDRSQKVAAANSYIWSNMRLGDYSYNYL